VSLQSSWSKKTPQKLIELLSVAVSRSSQSAVARATGLTQSAVGRYIKGVGEPTSVTLQKLADYFGVSVAYLRGEEDVESIIKGKLGEEEYLWYKIYDSMRRGNETETIENTKNVLSYENRVNAQKTKEELINDLTERFKKMVSSINNSDFDGMAPKGCKIATDFSRPDDIDSNND
jgi:transcriptional regulator with XRE-family HTH domain